MLNVNLQHECCREGYPLNLISLESIICKGSNCSPVELLGLEREHVLGEEKALSFICLEMSEKQSCAKPSLHLQHLWGSWWGEGPLEAFLDVYYFKTTARRTVFATWRCLAITLQMVFIRKMRDTIFAKHFNSKYRTVLLSQKQCLLLITMKSGVFFAFAITNKIARNNHEIWYKIFPKLRQTVSITALSLTWEKLQFELSSQFKGLRAAKEHMLERN